MLRIGLRGQSAFGGWQCIAEARIDGRSDIEGPREALKNGFGYVVRLFAIFEVDVQIAASVVGKSLEKLFNQTDAEVAHHGIFVINMVDESLAIGEIDRDPCERFIHGKKEKSIAADPAFFAECFFECLPKNDAGVFDRVVIINFDIARRFQLQIEESVAGKEREHVIEKGDAGFDFSDASAIDVQLHLDLSLFGIAGDFCYAWLSHDFEALRKACISLSVPMLTRIKAQVKGCFGK